MQEYTSANTSLNQIPAVSKLLDYDVIDCILDYGCGAYTAFKELVESHGVEYHGYDPYHKPDLNELVCEPDVIVCANVLNVIKEDEVIHEILDNLSSYPNAKVYIQVYEGNKSGQGKPTKKGCYQRNQKVIEYKEMIEQYFNSVTKKGNIFICK